MQFAYQFPEMVERLVLVSSGGLGPEVSPSCVPRRCPAPTSSFRDRRPGQQVGSALGRGLGAVGVGPKADVAEVARGYASLADPERRKAFLATLRSVVGTGPARRRPRPPLPGRSAADPDRLGRPRPDHPRRPRRSGPRELPGSRLEIFEGVGHLPQLEAPAASSPRWSASWPRPSPPSSTATSGGPVQDGLSAEGRARQDSNLRPLPPEGSALSS